jgi:uncharacterized protein (DUF1501 family)
VIGMTACAQCDEENGAATERQGLSRRGFLTAAGAAGAVAVASPMLSTRLAFAADPTYAGDTMVVISMRGGMDGLNVVVPGGDPDYARVRPDIGIPVSRLLAFDGLFGLHPALAPLLPHWQAGRFGAVQAVGQTDPTRSHFEAMEVMEQAAPGSSIRTGWLDRALGLRGAGTVVQAAQLGNSLPSSAFRGSAPELALGSIDDFVLWAADSGDPVRDQASITRWSTALGALHAGAPRTLSAPTKAAIGAITTTSQMKRAGYTPSNGAVYDTQSRLAMALRDVARLIRAGVGLQVAAIDYGDWDMHADEGTVDAGWMTDKLTEIAAALAAFAQDLGSLLDDVTVVTMSEFGRTVDQNGSGGTDHGHGNAMLLLGGGVNGGTVHGPWPTLADDARDDRGDLVGTTDYRTVLAEILRRRCGQGSIASVFPGLPAGDLGVVRTRAT